MPAFQLAEFEKQIAILQRAFSRPTDFLKLLREMFERYGMPAFRVGSGVVGVPEPAYHVPDLMIRQIELAMLPLIDENQGIVLRICKVLWKDRYHENRALGAFLIGKAPLDPPEAVISFLQEAGQQAEEPEMQVLLFSRGSERLRKEAPALWLKTLEDWLMQPQTMDPRIAFRSLLSVVNDAGFENTPPIFRMIEPFVLAPTREIEPALRDLIQALAARTEVETAYFFHEMIPFFDNERSLRLVRACLDSFQGENLRLIRESLRSKMTSDAKGSGNGSAVN